MPVSNQITLLVHVGADGKWANAAPVVAVGDKLSKFEPTSPTLVHEHQTWILRHQDDYNIYELHVCDLLDESRVIHVSLLIPSRRQLVDNRPMDLLETAYETACQQLVTGSWDEKPFKEMVENTPLELRTTILPVMRGNAPAAFKVADKQQLNAILTFSRYASLANVAHLELGFNTDSTFDIVSDTQNSRKLKKQKETDTPLGSALLQSVDLSTPDKPVQQEPVTKKKSRKKTFWLIALGVLVFIILAMMMAEDPNEFKSTKETTESIEEDMDSIAADEMWTDSDAMRAAKLARNSREAKEAAAQKAKEEEARRQKNKKGGSGQVNPTKTKPGDTQTPETGKSGFDIDNPQSKRQRLARDMVKNTAGYFKAHSITNEEDKKAITGIIRKYYPHDSWAKLEQMRGEVEKYLKLHGIK